MELARFGVVGSMFGWFGVVGFGGGELKWNRGAPTVITQPVLDVTMHWLLGPTIFTYLRTCHWVMIFEFWKQVSAVFIFHHCNPFFNHRVMKTIIQNSSKQTITRGTHMIWMIEIENWVISLKTHPIQTNSNRSSSILSQVVLGC